MSDDLARRDVTINAMAIDVYNGELLDPFGGVDDIESMTLTEVTDEFATSAERVGRVAALIAITGFTPSDSLIGLSRGMAGRFDRISEDQMWRQFFGKLLRRGKHFTQAFDYLQEVGVFHLTFPIFLRMKNTAQDRRHHPEGDVLTHTLLAMEFAAKHQKCSEVVMMSILCHDMGKVGFTTHHRDGRITSYGHETQTIHAEAFMLQVGFPKKNISKVIKLINLHMRNQFDTLKSRKKLYRTLKQYGLTIRDFVNLQIADKNGRGSTKIWFNEVFYEMTDEWERFDDMGALDPHYRPLVNGNDCIDAGYRGNGIGEVLEWIMELFESGEISTRKEALWFLNNPPMYYELHRVV